MPTRSATADWTGTIQDGNGHIQMGIGEYPLSFRMRMDEDEAATTNPEELIAAAQAGCYSMALSARLSSHNIYPEKIETTCNVTMVLSGIRLRISKIVITTRAKIDGMDDEAFQNHAQVAKENCAVSVALTAVDIELDAALMED